MIKKLIAFLTVLLAFLIPINFSVKYLTNTVSILVQEKERLDDKGYYLIFTDGEVFQNKDSIFFWKFNSSDIQGNLKIGSTYKVKVVGVRIPIFSLYRNIIEVL